MKDRRLIEDSLPLAEISEFSAKEKSIRHGNISTLHLWWARRPIAAARAVTLAALLPAPESDEQRHELHKLITDNLSWDQLKQPEKFAQKLRGALAANGRIDPPRILDPFSGGGALPLEAERLGAETYASDLNPVAHLVQQATLAYPQRFAHLSANETATEQLTNKSRLWAEIERWSHEILRRVKAQVGKHYDTPDGRQPLFFVWARTAKCPNPTCRAEVPLIGSLTLLKSKALVVGLQASPSPDRKRVEFKIVRGKPGEIEIGKGLISGANAVCLCCSQTASSKYLKDEGRSQRLGHRLIAVCSVGADGKKEFRIASPEEEAQALGVPQPDPIGPFAGIPDEPMPPKGTLGFRVQNYGFLDWGSIYNPRQALVLSTFASCIRDVWPQVREACADVDGLDKAVVTYLALCCSKASDFCSTITILNPHGSPRAKNTFRMQALQMTWDYYEANPLSNGSGSWSKITSDLEQTLTYLRFRGTADVARASADNLPHPDAFFDAIITDPPYYDAVPYSDLSDYFYVWLKRLLFDVYPDCFATELTPKRSEMVQNPAYEKTAAFFEGSMSRAFSEMHRTLKASGILVLVFAHKSTAAWETLLRALLENNLVVTTSWPIETEKPGRTRAIGSAALASSVFIVCRKRSAHHDGFLDDVEPELDERLHERLDYFWSQGIRGADFFMSAIGPAVEVFGHYKRVLKLSGEEVTVGELLDKVRSIVADYALQRIVHGARAGDVDDASRFYVIWRWAFGTAEVESGEAIHMAQSMGCEFNELVSDKGVLAKKGAKIRLRGPAARQKTRNLGDPSDSGVHAPLIDVLHRAANLWADGDRQGLADFLDEALPAGAGERLQRLAQSIVDVLVPGDKERALYENFLVGARNLPSPTKSDDRTTTQQQLFFKEV